MTHQSFPKPEKLQKKHLKYFKSPKSQRKLLIKELDTVVSKIIRGRGKCVRCGSIKALTTSHFWSRKRLSVRFDADNLDCVCLGCHLHIFEKEKMGEYRDYMLKKLGKKGYEALRVRAESPVKWSTADLEILLKSYEK